MSHRPPPGPEAAEAEADPMRPYRVHELLTRHTQGKRRGAAEPPDPSDGPSEGAPAASEMSSAAEAGAPVPDGFGPAQEDGR